MLQFTCREVIVKLKQGQRIRYMYTDDTRCAYFKVQNTENRLAIFYHDKNDNCLKCVAYNFASVDEFECSAMVTVQDTD